MEAVAKHDFFPDPSQENELGFKQGDKLLIMNYGDQTAWYNAELNGKQGMVPGNYIVIEHPTWYYGRITRATAENLLRNSRNEGAFLVRLSESSPQDFSLSVKCGSSVQHFRILRNTEKRYLLWQTSFYSINELVDYYRNETVSRTSTIYLCDMHPDDHQLVVEARYDFDPKDDQDGETELPFKKGDLITVFDRSDDNWWGGTIGDRSGFFPKSYVKKYTPSALDAAEVGDFGIDHE